MTYYKAQVEVTYPEKPTDVVTHTLTGIGNHRYTTDFPTEELAMKAIRKFRLDTLFNPAFVANARLIRAKVLVHQIIPLVVMDFQEGQNDELPF